MKLNKDKQIDFQSNAVFEGYNAKISEENMHKLWDLLQDPYKNSIGAVVREYVSNSFDSHAEADFIKNNSLADIRNEYPIYKDSEDSELHTLKTQLQIFNNDAVHVTIAKDNTGWFWATEDFGVGLSPERVRDVFCSYLKSTKEDTNNVIGAFGIGSKSGLSYTDVVFIKTRYNGTEYQYMLRKGEKAPRLDVVSNQSTTERNGTQIKIYIKSTQKYDWSPAEPELARFKEECVKQLAYFDNVFFSGTGIENNYTIARGINWVKSSNGNPFKGMHMCLGKVAYPIDWDSLGVDGKAMDIALHFEIGELDIIQTREDVKYTPRTKKAILDKIEEVRNELINKYNTEIGIETDDLLMYLETKNSETVLDYDLGPYQFTLNLYNLFRSANGQPIEASDQAKINRINFKPFKKVGINLKNKSSHKILDCEFKQGSYLTSSGLKHGTRSIWNLIQGNACIYRIKEDHNTRKSKYVRQKLENSDVFLIRAKTKKETKLKYYVELLTLEWDDRANWRLKIKTFQDELRKFMIDNTKSYDNVIVDKAWIAETYGKKRTYDKTKLLVYRMQEHNYTYTRGWNKFKMIKGDIDKMDRHTFIVGTKEQRKALYFMSHFYDKNLHKFGINGSSANHLHVLYVAPTNIKYFEDAKNVITMENFRKQRPFIRAMTAHYLSKHSSKYSAVVDFIKYFDIVENKKITDLNPEFTWVEDLKEYLTDNSLPQAMRHNTSDLWADAYQYALEQDIFDKQIIKKMDYLVEYFDFPLFKYLERDTSIEGFAAYIYLYNKVVPINKRKRLHPMFNINYKDQELEWLEEKEVNIINKIQLRNVRKC
jgi:hypothetical protein